MVQSFHSLTLPPSLRTPHLWPEQDKANLQKLITQQQESQAQAEASANFVQYQPDPRGYARDVLHEDLTDDQGDILDSVRDNRFTLCKASHAVGKTHVAAIAASWWYDCWPEGHICYITAPTWDQAKGLTFKKLKTMRRVARLPGKILDGLGWLKDTDEILEASHYVRALNADSGEGFQGEHDAPILIIVEEGVDVKVYIWEAIKGLTTNPDCRVLVIGNPTNKQSEFGKAAESDKYNVLTISALDHRNILAELRGQSRINELAISLQSISEMFDEHCQIVADLVDDAFEWHAPAQIANALKGIPVNGDTCFYLPDATFQGRVLGLFPTQADHQVVPEAWLKSQPVYDPLETDIPELGCDVARYGADRTTIFERRGAAVMRGRELRNKDAVQVAEALKEDALIAAQNAAPKATPEQHLRLAKSFRIKIDCTGHMGTGPHDILRADGYTPVSVNSSSRANDPEQFKNIRSELWWSTRVRAHDKRLDLSRLDPKLRKNLERELSTPTYKSVGHKIVEDKDVTIKRLDGASPDLADGVNLAFYNPPAQVSFVRPAGRLR